MNVLQMISSRGLYGAERMVIQLSRTLQGKGCRVMLAVFRNEGHPKPEIAARARESGLTVEEIPCGGRIDFRAVAHIRSIVETFLPHVIHSHGYKPNMYAWLAARNRSPKLISTCHGYTDATLTLRVNEGLDRLLLRRYDAIAAVSDPGRDRLVSSGVPSTKLKVIYNGIDCDNFERAEPALDHGGAQFVVGTVGRLTPQKNPEGFLKAAREVVKELPHCRFLFIGDGEEQSRLEQLTKQWHLESNVQFLGFRADMPNVYASLDLFVLPSLLENFPMSILESMAAGIPVIATRVGSVEKLVRDQETGILLRRGDQAGLNEAILHLLSDPVLMRKLGNTGRQWVKEHFSDQVMAEEYLSLYRDAGAPG